MLHKQFHCHLVICLDNYSRIWWQMFATLCWTLLFCQVFLKDTLSPVAAVEVCGGIRNRFICDHQDPSVFHICLGNNQYTMMCPGTLHFNVRTQNCDWPASVNCVNEARSRQLMNLTEPTLSPKSGTEQLPVVGEQNISSLEGTVRPSSTSSPRSTTSQVRDTLTTTNAPAPRAQEISSTEVPHSRYRLKVVSSTEKPMESLLPADEKVIEEVKKLSEELKQIDNYLQSLESDNVGFMIEPYMAAFPHKRSSHGYRYAKPEHNKYSSLTASPYRRSSTVSRSPFRKVTSPKPYRINSAKYYGSKSTKHPLTHRFSRMATVEPRTLGHLKPKTKLFGYDHAPATFGSQNATDTILRHELRFVSSGSRNNYSGYKKSSHKNQQSVTETYKIHDSKYNFPASNKQYTVSTSKSAQRGGSTTRLDQRSYTSHLSAPKAGSSDNLHGNYRSLQPKTEKSTRKSQAANVAKTTYRPQVLMDNHSTRKSQMSFGLKPTHKFQVYDRNNNKDRFQPPDGNKEFILQYTKTTRTYKQPSTFKQLNTFQQPNIFKQLITSKKPSNFKQLSTSIQPNTFTQLSTSKQFSTFKHLHTSKQPSTFKQPSTYKSSSSQPRKLSVFSSQNRDGLITRPDLLTFNHSSSRHSWWSTERSTSSSGFPVSKTTTRTPLSIKSHKTDKITSNNNSHKTDRITSNNNSHKTDIITSSNNSHKTDRTSNNNSHKTDRTSSNNSHKTDRTSNNNSHKTDTTSSNNSHKTDRTSSNNSHKTDRTSSNNSHKTDRTSSNNSHKTDIITSNNNSHKTDRTSNNNSQKTDRTSSNNSHKTDRTSSNNSQKTDRTTSSNNSHKTDRTISNNNSYKTARTVSLNNSYKTERTQSNKNLHKMEETSPINKSHMTERISPTIYSHRTETVNTPVKTKMSTSATTSGTTASFPWWTSTKLDHSSASNRGTSRYLHTRKHSRTHNHPGPNYNTRIPNSDFAVGMANEKSASYRSHLAYSKPGEMPFNSPAAGERNFALHRWPDNDERSFVLYQVNAPASVDRFVLHKPQTSLINRDVVIKADNKMSVLNKYEEDPKDKAITAYKSPVEKYETKKGKCSNSWCKLPDCRCIGPDIPGDLDAKDVPQMVMLTFDDSINGQNMHYYRGIFNGTLKNPNGCPIKSTFFVSGDSSDYDMVKRIYKQGHEIASHTLSHRNPTTWWAYAGYDNWEHEIVGMRDRLHEKSGVPVKEIVGMRAPFLQVGGDAQYAMLKENKFRYDSSMVTGNLYTNNQRPIWPFTLDTPPDSTTCSLTPCPTRSYPGLWEVPLVRWYGSNRMACAMPDACTIDIGTKGTQKFIDDNFNRHYTTNRAPFGIFIHASWFGRKDGNFQGLIEFLRSLADKEDVWVVTVSQALDWIQRPVRLSALNTLQSWAC